MQSTTTKINLEDPEECHHQYYIKKIIQKFNNENIKIIISKTFYSKAKFY